MLKSLLCAYIITGILLLILAVLLYKAGISENTVDAGVILIYVISTFSGGFVMGKLMGERKFLWGLILGAAYFILLLLITFGMYHTLQGSTSHLFTVILLCAGGGMMGGMVA
nr:TIGR04086 family membrane protein [uncultured Mediterraneibacter sp.]